MTINLTLFAQIIHFLIAYWMLRRWFFAPIFSIITAQDTVTADAEQKLHQQRLRNEIKQQEITAEKEATKSFFNSNKPIVVEQSEQRKQLPELTVSELNDAQQATAQKQLVELLVREVDK